MASVLVLGATGFIGRNLVAYLVENKLAAKIRAVDKVLPQTANFYPPHKAAFENEIVTFKQANLAKLESAESRGFALADGNTYDYVFNCAGETKLSQNEAVYQEKVKDLSVNCAKLAAKCGAKYLEISSARIYDGEKKISTETDKCKPWTEIAKKKLAAEELMKEIEGLKYTVIRPALVYGHGDYQAMMSYFICGAIYKHLKKDMEHLWTEKLRWNTVHVHDVARAMWHLRDQCDTENGGVFNLVDKHDTTYGTLDKMIMEIFGVKVKHMGSVKTTLVTKVGMGYVTEEANDMHLQPWSVILQEADIQNTPLTPYLDRELLYNNNIYIDGTKIESTGFTYEHPEFKVETIKEVLSAYSDMKLFPGNLL